MGGCGVTQPQRCAVGWLVKALLGKISPLESGGSLWLLLGLFTGKSLLAEGTAVLGIMQQFAGSSLACQGNGSETISEVFLRAGGLRAPPSLPTRFIS